MTDCACKSSEFYEREVYSVSFEKGYKLLMASAQKRLSQYNKEPVSRETTFLTKLG